jgi:hypothetical protein
MTCRTVLDAVWLMDKSVINEPSLLLGTSSSPGEASETDLEGLGLVCGVLVTGDRSDDPNDDDLGYV